MRARVLLIILIVIALIGLAAVYAVTQLDLGGFVDNLRNGETTVVVEGQSDGETTDDGEEPGLPIPTATPAIRLVNVVTARVNIPVGYRILAEHVEIRSRPDDNIAVLAGVTFDDPQLVVGQIARTDISAGQEIIAPMVALNATDIGGIGSDLANFVQEGRVAIAFPINRYSGLGFAVRSGDLVDMLMSMELVEIDPDFHTALPNSAERIDQEALLDGRSFLFAASTQGRLELIPELNLVAEITPSSDEQIARRVTQLTIQQAEVVWVGTWIDTRRADLARVADPEGGNEMGLDTVERENFPDVIIMSMSAQDALVLKWSMDRGLDIDLALRAQGDNSVFTTSSVSLPQLVEQGGLTIPEPGEFDVEPRLDEVTIPSLPPQNPNAAPAP
jgi:Flp pilus assembly protein CpaB